MNQELSARRAVTQPLLVMVAIVALSLACFSDEDSAPAMLQTISTAPAILEAVPSEEGPIWGPNVQVGALLRDWLGGLAAEVVPLDAASGMEVAVGGPLMLGYAATISVSPDGRLMAVSTRGAKVAVYDLKAWRLLTTIEAAPGLVLESWSDDASRVFGWRDYCVRGGYCGEDWQRDLWEIDVRAGTASRIGVFDFTIQQMTIAASRDGEPGRAYALAIRTDACCGIDPEGDPFIAVIDMVSGHVIAEISLPGMLAGQPRHWLGDESIYASYHPSMALAPAGSRLYVVDSVYDEVTIVALDTLEVDRIVEIKKKQSALRRAGNWLLAQAVATAEAKGGPVYKRQVQVTPKGRYLLVAGMTVEKVPNESPYLSFLERPAGLTIIETETMSVVFRESTIDQFQVTPDGRWLLGTGAYWDDDLADEEGFGGLVAHGLKLIDLDSLELAGHFWPALEARVGAVSPDSRFAYITTGGPGMQESRMSHTNCDVDCLRLSVIDLRSGEILAARLLDSDLSIMSLAP